MSQTASINPRIIEGLYGEALVLADEVRAVFDPSGQDHRGNTDEADRIALSCEALRTTTRMMHALAWLLNHRAYWLGELSEFQLRRHGRLVPDLPSPDPARIDTFSPAVRELIGATERFHARLARLDRDWQRAGASLHPPGAIDRLRERLEVTLLQA